MNEQEPPARTDTDAPAEAVIAADDTGILAAARLATVTEIDEHLESPDA